MSAVAASDRGEANDKHFYDNEMLEGQRAYYRSYITVYIDSWLSRIRPELEANGAVSLLDLGAGSCSTSIELAKHPFVKDVVAVDISGRRMQEMSSEMAALSGGSLDKFRFVEGNFNHPIALPDRSFDLIVMDAALHHARDIRFTLAEIRRLLRPGGIFVAQREAFLAPLTYPIAIRRLLESPEVRAGVAENAYLKGQYDYYLQASGFQPEFVPVYPELKFRLAWFLNGIAFAKYNIISRLKG